MDSCKATVLMKGDMVMQSKMKALVTYGAHDYRLEDVDMPSANEGEMIIKVEGCGICAGDLKAYKGGTVFWGDGSASNWRT